MFENLYTFKKDAAHVQFFQWLWGVDPTERYKGMCPYFWSYVVTAIILPVPVIMKLISYISPRMERWKDQLREHSINRRETRKKNYFKKWKNLTDSKKAWKVKRSKCFKKYEYTDGYNDMYYILLDKAAPYAEELRFKELEEIRKQNEAYEKARIIRDKKAADLAAKIAKNGPPKTVKYYLEDKTVAIIAMVVMYSIGAIFVVSILYYIYRAISYVSNLIDWYKVGEYTLWGFGALILTAIAVLVGWFLIVFVVLPIIKWVSCIKCPSCKRGILKVIGAPFRWLIKGLVYGGEAIGNVMGIVIDMTYNFYKAQCPPITWVDADKDKDKKDN